MIAFSVIYIALAWTSIYSFTVVTIEGEIKSLSSYQGKKLMIITLPTVINGFNESLLFSLDSLGDANESILNIIAVPSYEDGFTLAQKEELRQWYRSFLDTGIVITDGMYTRKTSGSQQHALFHWLTHSLDNQQFDIDVAGPQTKFMVRSNGELFGVIGVHTKLGNPRIHAMLQTQ